MTSAQKICSDNKHLTSNLSGTWKLLNVHLLQPVIVSSFLRVSSNRLVMVVEEELLNISNTCTVSHILHSWHLQYYFNMFCYKTQWTVWELPSHAAECGAIYHSFRNCLSNIICTTGVGDEVSCQKKSRLFSCILPTGSHGNDVQNLRSFAWTSFRLFHCSFICLIITTGSSIANT